MNTLETYLALNENKNYDFSIKHGGWLNKILMKNMLSNSFVKKDVSINKNAKEMKVTNDNPQIETAQYKITIGN